MKTNLEDYSQYCQIVGATDIGCKRAANEDFLGFEDTPNGRVAVVCDGMGGHVGGATASHIAVDSILAYLREHYHTEPNEAIIEAIFAANRNILLHAQIHPELTGMGSTCVLLLVRNGKVYIGHVGDSRIYLIRESTIKQLTKDHSFVQTLVDAGQISEAEAEHHPRKNEITNALGIPNMQPATIREDAILPQAGDVFLLCSDGLSNMVQNTTIAKIAGKIGTNMQHRADSLIEHAKQNGGLDNITCELIEFSITTTGKRKHPQNNDKRKKALLQLSLLALALLLLGGGGYILWKHLYPQTITETLGTITIHENKKICTIIFREESTLIQNFSGDTIWRDTAFIADKEAIQYDNNKLSIAEEGKDRISLQIKDDTNPETEEEWSFSLQNGRHKREFRFKITSSDSEGSGSEPIKNRHTSHVNLGFITVGSKKMLVSITPDWSSQIEIKDAKGKSLWKRIVPEITEDSIKCISPKIQISSKKREPIEILLKKSNDHPKNDSIVFSINSPDTIFTFSFRFSTGHTQSSNDSSTSDKSLSNAFNNAQKNIPQENTSTTSPRDKSTEDNNNSKTENAEEPVSQDSSETSHQEESEDTSDSN